MPNMVFFTVDTIAIVLPVNSEYNVLPNIQIDPDNKHGDLLGELLTLVTKFGPKFFQILNLYDSQNQNY